ncbi:hypothetical protein BC830DRAFT_1097873 [Chytriomyces sp. MP71]|nr:hypothetical protein BC830DRAFT_1097873 [Chytriomyces sp. MP71]
MASMRAIARLATAIGLTAFAGYIVYLVVLAAEAQNISDGFDTIKRNAWALSALVDYVASVPLCATWAALRICGSARPWLAVAFGLSCLLLGNPVVLVIAAGALVFTSAGLLVRDSTSLITRRVQAQPLHVMAFLLATGVVLVGFTCATFAAIVSEPFSDGIDYVKAHPWALASFVDSFGGVLFAMAYVLVREWGSWALIAAFWAGLLLGGNGVSCLYVLLIGWNAVSVADLVLSGPSLTDKYWAGSSRGFVRQEDEI